MCTHICPSKVKESYATSRVDAFLNVLGHTKTTVIPKIHSLLFFVVTAQKHCHSYVDYQEDGRPDCSVNQWTHTQLQRKQQVQCMNNSYVYTIFKTWSGRTVTQQAVKGLTIMLLVANLANTNSCKKSEKWLKPWHMGTHLRVLSESNEYQHYVFQKSFLPCALDGSSLSIGCSSLEF